MGRNRREEKGKERGRKGEEKFKERERKVEGKEKLREGNVMKGNLRIRKWEGRKG